ncbi:MAG: corrinoid protein [Deltaproteobacteria bacterium]|nr:corrinoid protein [Deltaproteobacteria bacterium]
MFNFTAITEALIACDQDKVLELVEAGLRQAVPAKDLLDLGLIAGMDVIGERMEKEEMFIPEVLMAAMVMSAAVDLLKPRLAEGEVGAKGKVVIGTVKGDLHDIGKNLVAMMLKSAGLEVHNIGVDIAPERFVEEIKVKKADILALSALLTTTMPMMRETVAAVVEAGVRNQVKILVGGAPVTQAFADEIGADGYAADAGSATKLVKSLLP